MLWLELLSKGVSFQSREWRSDWVLVMKGSNGLFGVIYVPVAMCEIALVNVLRLLR